MLNSKEVANMARKAIENANNEAAPGSFNDGYTHGYADALRKVAGLSYYAVSADGSSWSATCSATSH